MDNKEVKFAKFYADGLEEMRKTFLKNANQIDKGVLEEWLSAERSLQNENQYCIILDMVEGKEPEDTWKSFSSSLVAVSPLSKTLIKLLTVENLYSYWKSFGWIVAEDYYCYLSGVVTDIKTEHLRKGKRPDGRSSLLPTECYNQVLGKGRRKKNVDSRSIIWTKKPHNTAGSLCVEIRIMNDGNWRTIKALPPPGFYDLEFIFDDETFDSGYYRVKDIDRNWHAVKNAISRGNDYILKIKAEPEIPQDWDLDIFLGEKQLGSVKGNDDHVSWPKGETSSTLVVACRRGVIVMTKRISSTDRTAFMTSEYETRTKRQGLLPYPLCLFETCQTCSSFSGNKQTNRWKDVHFVHSVAKEEEIIRWAKRIKHHNVQSLTEKIRGCDPSVSRNYVLKYLFQNEVVIEPEITRMFAPLLHEAKVSECKQMRQCVENLMDAMSRNPLEDGAELEDWMNIILELDELTACCPHMTLNWTNGLQFVNDPEEELSKITLDFSRFSIIGPVGCIMAMQPLKVYKCPVKEEARKKRKDNLVEKLGRTRPIENSTAQKLF